MTETRFESLCSALKSTLSEWLDDRREEGLVDDDLLDMIETAASALFDALPDLSHYTDGEPTDPIGDLDEDEIRRAFEDYAEHWDEMEWRYQTKTAQPGPIEEMVIEFYGLLQGEPPDEDHLEEVYESLKTCVEQAGYDVN